MVIDFWKTKASNEAQTSKLTSEINKPQPTRKHLLRLLTTQQKLCDCSNLLYAFSV
jgi:hypothetical protein